jgi:tetratricopeptide (TPR) repeat protein
VAEEAEAGLIFASVKNRVLLVGWDAADWRVIQPLLDAGQLPALSRVIDNGVMGNLASQQPMLSPMLWTTIATGKRAHEHGICGFVEPRPDGQGLQPVASTTRQGKAVWNILAQNGLRSQVTGWLATHPAEPLPGGVCVSNLFAKAAEKHSQLPAGTVHPARLEETLAALRLPPAEITAEHLLPFVPRAAEIDQSDPVARKPLLILARLLSECASVHAAATWLMENEPWDFAAIYYEAIDHFGHAFMPFHPPRMPDIDAGLFDLYREVMAGIYRFHDMMLDRLLQLAGEETTVLIVSDHGFHSNHLRPGARGETLTPNPVAWHRPHGIIAMRGPGLLRDERIYGATLLDIAPTVLSLFGLPAGRDMEGRPLVQAFLKTDTPERIPSWEELPGESGQHPASLPTDPVEAREMIRQLVDLGYLAEPSDSVRQTIEAATLDLRFNLAQSWLHAGRPTKAIELLEPLMAGSADNSHLLLALAQAHLAVGEPAKARPLLERALTRANDDAPEVHFLLGLLLLAENRPRLALSRLRRAERAEPRLPRLHNQIAAVYLRGRQWRAAARACRKALQIDPESAHAQASLAAALLRMGRPKAAAEAALSAAGLQHFFPAAHFQLGRALFRIGETKRAMQALEIALEMRPGVASAHRYAARLYTLLGKTDDSLRHRQLAAGESTDSRLAA